MNEKNRKRLRANDEAIEKAQTLRFTMKHRTAAHLLQQQEHAKQINGQNLFHLFY